MMRTSTPRVALGRLALGRVQLRARLLQLGERREVALALARELLLKARALAARAARARLVCLELLLEARPEPAALLGRVRARRLELRAPPLVDRLHRRDRALA